MENVSQTPKESSVATKLTSKFLGITFGYMFIGLFITAAVCFGYSYFIASYFGTGDGYISSDGLLVVSISTVVAFIVSYIITFANSIYSTKTGKAPWVGFILYAICMGVAFSVILLAGIDFETIGEALAITALSFGVMFFIGYFTKTDLSPLVFALLALLICIALAVAFYGVLYLINPNLVSLLDFGVGIAIILFCLITVTIEANRIGAMVEQGQGNNNLALYCAFNLYTNFITLFVRILFILLASKKRK